jgi:hypothetical protein
MSNNIIRFLKKVLYSILDFFKYFSRRHLGDDVMHIRFAQLHQPKLKYDIRKKFFTFSIKTKDDLFKYLFVALMLVLAVYMPWKSTDLGISDMEIQHMQYAEAYYNYHAHGDNALLSMSYFTHHGQFTDNLCYALSQWFHVADPFSLRHIMSAVFGWLTILTLGFFLVRLFAWRAAFIGALFLFISPRFLGNAFTDLTDTTFAFAFLFSIYQIYLFCSELPIIKWYRILLITLGIIFANSIHIGGFFLIACLFLYPWGYYLTHNPIKKFTTQAYWANLLFLTLVLAGITLIVHIVDLLYLPFALQDTVLNPFRAIPSMLTEPHPVRQLFDNEMIWANNTPPNYFFKYLFITIPFVILIGFILFWGFIRTLIRQMRPAYFAMILFTFFVPLFYVAGKGVNIYEDFALYLFIYPFFVLIATSGYEGILRRVDDRYTNFVIVAIIFLLTLMPLRHVVLNHPYENVYFNEISDGIHNAYGKYELDYNFHGNKEACEWLKSHIHDEQVREFKDVDKVIVGTDGNKACQIFFEQDTAFIQLLFFPYHERNEHHWDYYISFANAISSHDLQQQRWPPKDAIKTYVLEGKTMIAIMQNKVHTIPQDTVPAPESAPLHTAFK